MKRRRSVIDRQTDVDSRVPVGLITCAAQVMPLEQHVCYLFDCIDKDDGGDGNISKQEMVRAYGDGCGSLFGRIDSQNRGEISFDDWRDYWVYELAGTTQKEKASSTANMCIGVHYVYE